MLAVGEGIRTVTQTPEASEAFPSTQARLEQLLLNCACTPFPTAVVAHVMQPNTRCFGTGRCETQRGSSNSRPQPRRRSNPTTAGIQPPHGGNPTSHGGNPTSHGGNPTRPHPPSSREMYGRLNKNCMFQPKVAHRCIEINFLIVVSPFGAPWAYLAMRTLRGISIGNAQGVPFRNDHLGSRTARSTPGGI